MIINKGTNDFTSLTQVKVLKENLMKKYKLTNVKDYGSCVVLINSSNSIVAEIFIEGNKIRYQVDDYLFYER